MVGTLAGPTRTPLDKPAGLVFFINFSCSGKTKNMKCAKQREIQEGRIAADQLLSPMHRKPIVGMLAAAPAMGNGKYPRPN